MSAKPCFLLPKVRPHMAQRLLLGTKIDTTTAGIALTTRCNQAQFLKHGLFGPVKNAKLTKISKSFNLQHCRGEHEIGLTC